MSPKGISFTVCTPLRCFRGLKRPRFLPFLADFTSEYEAQCLEAVEDQAGVGATKAEGARGHAGHATVMPLQEDLHARSLFHLPTRNSTALYDIYDDLSRNKYIYRHIYVHI